MKACSGKVRTSGRKVNGLIVESLDGTTQLQLPTVIECNYLPDNRNEIPVREIAESYPHLYDIADQIPALDNDACISLLIGRDIVSAHHLLDHRVGPGNTPYAQKLPLGWTIIGECCLGSVHLPEEFSVFQTNILPSGRGTLFDPCNSFLELKESSDVEPSYDNLSSKTRGWESFGSNVFDRRADDDKPGLSVDDRSFLKIMDTNFHKDDDGKWICPLPFKEPRPILQNNYTQVLKRAKTLDKSLDRDPVKKEHFIDFMGKMIQDGHAEVAPLLNQGEECWYLPILGVYHPKMKDQVRIVFDSAAKYNGMSLNGVLLSGPDFTNSLMGILMRFRREAVAVIADIQQMFYCFKVDEKHRNYLRFLWHRWKSEYYIWKMQFLARMEMLEK